MKLRFTKMHGAGNDYIYVDCFLQTVEDPAALALRLSDRRKGVGGDGVILVCPSDVADGRMRMFNLDGSEGKMCGNGIRCVAKFLYDKGYAPKETMTIETLSGIKTIRVFAEDGKVRAATVDMGAPMLNPAEIPVRLAGSRAIDVPVQLAGAVRRVSCVSMGNPHCVLFVEDVAGLDLEKIGPAYENDPLFPDRVNTEFIKVLDDHRLQMRVWERGSGETLACGTGACAAVVAAVENGLCPRNEPIAVELLGGELTITVTEQTVYMTGEAVTVFEGEVEL